MERAGLTLRVNLLEQCQLACGYCRPGLLRRPTAAGERLTADDCWRLGQAFAAAGVTKVRFTGGEPLLRPDLGAVLLAFGEALPGARLAFTTNGQRLGAWLRTKERALVHAVTVHVDSLRPERYRALMGDGEPTAPLEAVLAAKALGLVTKLNVVVQRGLNDDELPDFLAWSRATGVEVRFIELMNTGSAADFTRRHFVSGAEVLARVAATEPVRALGRRDPADPATLYALGDGTRFGLIASDTQPFCGACTRLRLSPAGELRGCLYQPAGVDLRTPLRRGAGLGELTRLVRGAVQAKRSHHPSERAPRAAFSMADIGG